MRNKLDKKHLLSLCKPGDYGIMSPPMSAQVALNELCRCFLGDDWYDESGYTSPEQVNTNIVYTIEKLYKGCTIKNKKKKKGLIMTFGNAIECLKKGKKVARTGWNGKNMFLYLINGREFQNALKYGYGEYENEPTIRSSIAMKTAQNTIVIGWLASQTDMLSEDWIVIE